jgi:osmotically-inducible protein OsmY
MGNPFSDEHDRQDTRVRPRHDLGDRNPSQGFSGGYGGALSPRSVDDAGGSYAASRWVPAPIRELFGGTPRADQSHDRHNDNYRGRGPRNGQRSDARIEDDVCLALTEHPGIDATEVEVQVQHGEVLLRGTVVDRATRRLAEDVAASCRGVHDVHNTLRISSAARQP